ncbi:superoxide dismutase[Cu-Zn] [Sphingomonas sp. DT-207]|uniref:superoxide dismutase[Cu-Zn] n=1 Tax=Sphingomonas sp. DT-207 TaxID=3396167 RepID=UPI003F1AE355
MAIRMTDLLILTTATAAMVIAAAVDAAERRSGVLYDGAGRELGMIAITDAPKGVLLRIEAKGLPPGWHGMHFHEKADCGDTAFKGAGGHVHSQKPIVHGFLVEDANDAGDLPNIHVGADGSATVELYSTLVSADGQGGRPALRDADGSALVIHANPDDYKTQPIGGAGERIACAVVP